MSCHVPPPQLYTNRRSWTTKPMSSCMGVPWTGLKSGIVTEHDTSHNFRDVFIIIFTFQTTCLLLFCSFVCSRDVHRARSFRLVHPAMLPMLSKLKACGGQFQQVPTTSDVCVVLGFSARLRPWLLGGRVPKQW